MNYIQQKTNNGVRYNTGDFINEADRAVLRYESTRNATFSSGAAGIVQNDYAGVIGNYAGPLQYSQIVYFINDSKVAESEYSPVPIQNPVASRHFVQKMSSFSLGTGSSQLQIELAGSQQWNPAQAEVQILSSVAETPRLNEELPVAAEPAPEAGSEVSVNDAIQSQESAFKTEEEKETVTTYLSSAGDNNDIAKSTEHKESAQETKIPDINELSVAPPQNDENDDFYDVSSFSHQSEISTPEDTESEQQYRVEFTMSDGSTISLVGNGDEVLSSVIFSGHGDITGIDVFNDDGDVNQVVSEFVSDINNTILLQNIDLNKLMALAGIAVQESGNNWLSLIPENEAAFPDISQLGKGNMSNEKMNFAAEPESYFVTPDEDFFMTEGLTEMILKTEVPDIAISVDDALWDREGFHDYELQHDTIWVNTHLVAEPESSLIL
ncbi:TPA: hypothetical protein JAN03_15035 [Citrobacter freundii]|nr:hypothetical protein [Citrobacter freundii]